MAKRDQFSLEIFGPLKGHERTCDLLFLHGISGTAKSTFRGAEGQLWTTLLLEDIPGCRIIHPRYKSPRFRFSQRVGLASIDDYGPALVDLLTANGVGEVTAAIIAHSLGANYAVSALRFSARAGSIRHRALIKAVSGVTFIAAPLKGSPIASLAGVLPFATPLLRELSEKNSQNRERADWYSKSAGATYAIKTTAYVETRGIKGIIFVNRSSANPSVLGCDPIPIDRDHVNIAHVSNVNDGLYPSLLPDLRACVGVKRIPQHTLTLDDMQLLARDLSTFDPPAKRRAAFISRMGELCVRLGIGDVKVRTSPEWPIHVEVMQAQHAVALGLFDLTAFYPDEITFQVVQGPI